MFVCAANLSPKSTAAVKGCHCLLNHMASFHHASCPKDLPMLTRSNLTFKTETEQTPTYLMLQPSIWSTVHCRQQGAPAFKQNVSTCCLPFSADLAPEGMHRRIILDNSRALSTLPITHVMLLNFNLYFQSNSLKQQGTTYHYLSTHAYSCKPCFSLQPLQESLLLLSDATHKEMLYRAQHYCNVIGSNSLMIQVSHTSNYDNI